MNELDPDPRKDIQWTEQLPTKKGFYWWRLDISRHATICKVSSEGYVWWFSGGPTFVSNEAGQWFGPLTEPGGDAIAN
jgi:hypothetical protein